MNKEDLFNSRTASFSEDREYRYTLWQWWNTELTAVQFICLNPSTANEIQDDPTVRRCINFAYDWGYGGFCMTNLFAYRATDPKDMRAHEDPVGPDNDDFIKEIYNKTKVKLTVAAWGTHGDYMGRANHVVKMLGPLFCLRINKEGSPAHPLYLSKDNIPFMYTDKRELWMRV